MKAKVSIIIPTYNYGRYIQRAINSALQQSYPNIDVIVVDDGSTDNTQAILAEYGDTIRNIKQRNQGASAARNHGISEAHGDYIAFLDADDYYLPGNISTKVEYLVSHPEYQWCYSDWAWVDEQGTIAGYGHEPKQSMAHYKLQGDVFSDVLGGLRLGTNVFLFRRSILLHAGGFDEQLTTLEDYDLFLRISRDFPIGYIDQALCHIYAHSGSLGMGTSKQKGYYNRWLLNQKLSRNFPEETAEDKGFRRVQADLYRNLAAIALSRNCFRRARILLCTSLRYSKWQLGLVWFAAHAFWRGR